MTSSLDRPIEEIFLTKEKLCEAAEESSLRAPDDFRHSVYLYYIARYLVAVYESKFSELPIQVWNEYRNALDHFMRHLSKSNDDPHGLGRHLGKMEGHLQRAVLDVSKLLCVHCHDAIDAEIKHWGRDVLELMEGGDFYANTTKSLREVTELFEVAKINDSRLGHNSDVNRKVIDRFIESFFKFDAIHRALIMKGAVLSKAKAKLDDYQATNEQIRERALQEAKEQISPIAMRKALKGGIISGIIVGLPSLFIGWWLGYTFPAPTTVSPPAPPPVRVAPPFERAQEPEQSLKPEVNK